MAGVLTITVKTLNLEISVVSESHSKWLTIKLKNHNPSLWFLVGCLHVSPFYLLGSSYWVVISIHQSFFSKEIFFFPGWEKEGFCKAYHEGEMRICKNEAEFATASCKDLGVSQFTHISDEGTDLFGHSIWYTLCKPSACSPSGGVFWSHLAIKMTAIYIFYIESSADPHFCCGKRHKETWLHSLEK